MNRQQILDFLRARGDEISLQFRARVEGIFGSVARGEERPDSDVDVLVQFNDGASLLDLVGLADFLEDNLHRPVDVVSTRALREEIRSHVEKDLLRV